METRRNPCRGPTQRGAILVAILVALTGVAARAQTDPPDALSREVAARPLDPRDALSREVAVRPGDRLDALSREVAVRPRDPLDALSREVAVRPGDPPDALSREVAVIPIVTAPNAYSRDVAVWPLDPRDTASREVGLWYFTSVNDVGPAPLDAPAAFTVKQPQPNPVSGGTQIRFGIPSDMSVSFQVFDLAGRRILNTAHPQTLKAGWHAVVLDASRWSAGVYFYRFRAGGQQKEGKLIVQH